ncbi:oxidoreductase [Luteibaculum oceani]|uniref:Bifunctional salicylyl-CoA 5-hydroxylase/oxidoreductase n=1 Tax=Luteibaculum oceani TaxID=1294296 RepID=A0A5C6VB11_9FLAO|nr:FAD-dependent monooxygenase [Luteibaculum oceani]TXC82100.1 bifunctional salicylyl-CoA 5-hydroxylase/oxidoreductase [Luteibaculum oceani]
MRIAVIGGGPGGLYFSILTKKANPDCHIEVYERNKADDSFGFGVVFSDETLSEFLTRDPKSYELIRTHFAYWDDLDIARDGKKVRITGNGFCGCSRKKLLQLLQQRCKEEGVQLHFETEQTDLSIQAEYDIVVAADGIGSKIREQLQKELGTQVKLKSNKFVWMGSTRPLDAFTYWFKQTQNGAMVAHSYQYEKGKSTWIFECSPETWKKWGFDQLNEDESQQLLEEIYKDELEGHKLIQNKSYWRQFPHVTNANWHHKNIVLLGDAKATAHFSIGSGTKLAMESAIALSDAIIQFGDQPKLAFEKYEESRRQRVEMIQHAANVSLHWFENMDRHIRHPFYQFAFGVMTRAKKVTFENLQLRDSSFTKKVLQEFIEQNNYPELAPPAFTSFKLGALSLSNRIVMFGLPQNKAKQGLVNDWHLTHYGSRACQGLGLIITEPIAVNKDGACGINAPGLYEKEQTKCWRRITDFIHQNSNCKIAAQLAHAGRKASPQENEAPLFSASPIPFLNTGVHPKQMDEKDMEFVRNDFVRAAKNAVDAGFDMVEIKADEGQLLASFLSPLTNLRTDKYGGKVENRLRFPLAVFNAIRKELDQKTPISVRISVEDWAEGGISAVDAEMIARAFKNAGADIINVTTGNTVSHQKVDGGRMYQTPYSEEIRNKANIATITSGKITDIDQINTIILNGRADLVGLGKPLLLHPGFVNHAAAHENYKEHKVPQPYETAKGSLFQEKTKERRQIEQMKKALKPESHKKS